MRAVAPRCSKLCPWYGPVSDAATRFRQRAKGAAMKAITAVVGVIGIPLGHGR